MTWIHRVGSMFRWVFRRSEAERQLSDELEAYVEMAAADKMRHGVSPAEARRLALAEIGGIETAKERVRTGRHGASLDEVGQNVRYGLRTLGRNRGFTAVIVLTLAFGIGANTAIFSIIDSLLLQKLPVRDPSRLAVLAEAPPGDQYSWTYPIWEQIRERRDAFAGAAAWATSGFDVSDGGEMDMVRGLWTSGEFFDVLGVPMTHGRAFSSAHDARGGGPDGPVAVISHAFWQRKYGGAPDIVGRVLTIERNPFTIIGVTAPGFTGLTIGRGFDVALPFTSEPVVRGTRDSRLDARSSWWLNVLVRLKHDQSVAQAATTLRGFQSAIRDATMIPDLSPSDAARYLDMPLTVDPDVASLSGLRSQYQRPLVVLLVVTGVVLLIACANIANLLLARATARGHEWSLRLALGASRGRLARQVLTESVLLASIGAVAALIVAQWGSQLLVRQLSDDAVVLDLSLNASVLAFAAGVTTLTALIFGLAPAMRVTRGLPMDALRQRAGNAGGAARARVAGGLVIVQVVLSLVLVVGAGLFLRTFTGLTGQSLGFDSDRVMLAQVSTRRAEVPPEQRLEMFERIRERVSDVPGITGTGLTFIAPLGGRIWMRQVHVSGSAVTTMEERHTAPSGIGTTDRTIPATEPYTALNAVSPGWSSTIGLTVRAGRDIAASDRAGTQRVAVVNEAFVRKFLAGQDPIGHTVQTVMRGAMPPREIVGVVNDAAYRSPREGAVPTVYVPLAQFDADANDIAPADIVLGARADAMSPAEFRNALTSAVTEVHPRLTLFFRPLAEQVQRTMVQERLLAVLSVFFGALAVVMAAIGLYGVTSYSVNLRRSEIAVRLALGATRAGVIRLMLARAALLVGIGLAIGLAVSIYASRFVETLLFGLAPTDPGTLIGATCLLALVGFVAGWIPAMRASRLDPAASLARS